MVRHVTLKPEFSHGRQRKHGLDIAPLPDIRKIHTHDLIDALRLGWADFMAKRSDVLFLTVIYPIVALLMARLVIGYNVIPLLFPLAAGFALVGPLAAIGLYEISRRREKGMPVHWRDVLAIRHAPSFGSILILGLMLLSLFLAWLVCAQALYTAAFGSFETTTFLNPAHTSLAAFAQDILFTRQGWWLMGVGCGVGFLFALAVLALSVVSFPMLLDRDVGAATAVLTSLRAVAHNPGPMALWGLIVAAGLVLGSLPLFAGLAVVLPLLGHATWHLYRKLVV